MDISEEMHILKKCIGRDDPLDPFLRGDDGRIVPNAYSQTVPAGGEPPANPFDQLVFAGHPKKPRKNSG